MDQASLGLPVPFTEPALAAVRGDPYLASLARRLQDADPTALEPFVQATQAMAFRLALHLLNDYHAAQDALQEAYLAVLREVRSLKNPAAVRAWFMRIVSNRCIEVLRKHRPKSLGDVGSGELTEDPRLAEIAGQRHALQVALAALSPTDRAVVLLRDCLELSYDEIGAALGITLGTVKSRLIKTRRRLARELMKEDAV